MHFTARLTNSVRAQRSAQELLGGNHPLARVLNRMRTVAEQSMIVAALLLASVVAHLEGAHGALVFLVAAAVLQVALGCDLALLSLRKRECARDLIVDGRGRLPLASVERERDRLLDRGYHDDLARWCDAVREEAEHPVRPLRSPRPLFRVAVVAPVTGELDEIARLLRSGEAAVRGVAMIERLLTHGASPLYGEDVRTLREELHRIRFILDG